MYRVRVLDGKKVFFPGRRKKPVQNLFQDIFSGFYHVFFHPWKKSANTVHVGCIQVRTEFAKFWLFFKRIMFQ